MSDLVATPDFWWSATALLFSVVGIALFSHFCRPHPSTEQQLGSQYVAAPEPVLLRLLADDDLSFALARCMTPRTVGLCGLTCRTAAVRFQQRELARMCHEYGHMPRDDDPEFDRRLENQALECCRPGENGFPDNGLTDSQVQSRFVNATADGRNGVWSFHRRYLHSHTPVFGVVRFAKMSDQATPEIDMQMSEVAEWLDRHPGLQIKIIGYAWHEGLDERWGAALAQARAARVRQRLLFQMMVVARCGKAADARSQGRCYWRDWVESSSGSVSYDKASEGVRPPDAGHGRGLDGGFLGLDANGIPRTNGNEDEVLQFYEPSQWDIGHHVRATGRFPVVDSAWSTPTRQLQLDDLYAQFDDEDSEVTSSAISALTDVVEISVVGFEPHSHLAF